MSDILPKEVFDAESKKAGLQPTAPMLQPSVLSFNIQGTKNFYNIPNSTASNLIMEVLGAGDDVEGLPERKKQVNHATELEVMVNGRCKQIRLASPTAQVTIELADIDRLTRRNNPAKKLFVLVLIKANEQAIHEGILTRDYISFPLQELVDIGFYKSLRSARTGFNAGAEILTSLKIKGHMQHSKRKESPTDALEVLFFGAHIENNQCLIRLNYAVDWDFIMQYFTILPLYYFKLSNRASDLLLYICYLARQNTRKIEQQGYFTISFRAIQQRLQLPSEKGSLNPQRDIKDQIENAIEELETEHSLYYQNTEFSLLPVSDDTAPITDYLDEGYLKVFFTGAFAEPFAWISKSTAKKIDAAQKRQARITEKAIAINMAKRMQSEETDEEK